MEGVPTAVGGIGIAVSAVAAKGAFFVKIQTVRAGVGIYPVQNYPDAAGVSRLAQGDEVRLGAQHGIRGLVVAGIVAVAGKALADGVQVQDIHAHGGNIVHLFRDSPEVAAIKVVVQHLAGLRGTPVHFLVPVLVDGVRLHLAGQVTHTGFIKAIREDLIDGGTLGPVRRCKVCGNTAQLPAVAHLHIGIGGTQLEQAERSRVAGDSEVIEAQSTLRKGKAAAEDIISAAPLLQVQRHILHMHTVLPVDNALYRGSPHGCGDMDVKCTVLPGYQGAEGILEHTLFAVE